MPCGICFASGPRPPLLGKLQDLSINRIDHDNNEEEPRGCGLPTAEFPYSKPQMASGLYVFDFNGRIYSRRTDCTLRPGSCRPIEQAGTPSGTPVFEICRYCFGLIPEFLAFRNKYPLRNANFSWTSLDDVYHSVHKQWQMTDQLERQDKISCLRSDPCVPIPSLPDYILAELRPVNRDECLVANSDDLHHTVTECTDLSNSARKVDQPSSTMPTCAGLHGGRQVSELENLPVELIAMISEHLDARSCFALRSSCRLMSAAIQLDQRFWYRQFMQRSLFGFFTDFAIVRAVDEIGLKSRRQGKLPPNWDWKGMVHLLGKSSSFDMGGAFEYAPASFRTRRALWKVMEDLEELGLGTVPVE